jgi:hypothetical protein
MVNSVEKDPAECPATASAGARSCSNPRHRPPVFNSRPNDEMRHAVAALRRVLQASRQGDSRWSEFVVFLLPDNA